jgi:hypothetical protein
MLVPSTRCGVCKIELDEDRQLSANKRLPCPNCGSLSRRYELKCLSQSSSRPQMSAKATDADNNLKAERMNTNNGYIVSSMSHDVQSPALVESERITKPIGKAENLKAKNEEEKSAALALCRAYNRKNTADFNAVCKESVDGSFEDAWLVHGDERLPIQICHLDTKLVASLITTGSTLTQTIDASKLAGMIKTAILKKAQHYADADKASCILLLFAPYGLGEIVQKDLQQYTFDFGGFMEVWISSSTQDCFDLRSV